MKTNPLQQPALMETSPGGPATRKMMRERAVELAVNDGRVPQDVSKSDWDQAKLELTTASDQDPKEALLESAPESARWDFVPGSSGRQAPDGPDDGEDEERRNESAQLVEKGAEEAVREQSVQAGGEEKKAR